MEKCKIRICARCHSSLQRAVMEESTGTEEMSLLNDADHIERLLDDFFLSPGLPVSNHEEWLLRLAATLMEREASLNAVSFSGRGRGRRNNGRMG